MSNLFVTNLRNLVSKVLNQSAPASFMKSAHLDLMVILDLSPLIYYLKKQIPLQGNGLAAISKTYWIENTEMGILSRLGFTLDSRIRHMA